MKIRKNENLQILGYTIILINLSYVLLMLINGIEINYQRMIIGITSIGLGIFIAYITRGRK